MGYQKERFGIEDGDADRNCKLRSIFANGGFYSTNDLSDIQAGLDIGDDTLGGGLVSAKIVQACEDRTQRCFYVRKAQDGTIEGFIALLYLNAQGFEALMTGRLRPGAPDLNHLTQEGEAARALYVWCLAARTEASKRALVKAVTLARRKAFNHIPIFARPVSREGRMMTAALDAPNGPASWLGWIPQTQDNEVLGNLGGENGRIAAE
ncbi:hypothetical protein [Woodsholea maritima]|uniref:hypothetical protein n=1 Tax=Woodsholea maritima TaxID=240237 RepID=UPI00035F78BF|nr:hypothetical protein [Woodsholea maritima]